MTERGKDDVDRKGRESLKVSRLVFESRGGSEQLGLNPGMWDLSERAAAHVIAEANRITKC